MTREENVTVVNRYMDGAWNKGNLDAVDELLAENYLPGTPPTRDAP